MNMNGTIYWIPTRIRQEVSIESQGTCNWCKKKATSSKIDKRGILKFYDEKGKVFHIDHVKPVYLGGSHSKGNLVIACRDCNLKKRKKKSEHDLKAIEVMNNINE